MLDLKRDTATATCPRPDASPSDEGKRKRTTILTNSIAFMEELLQVFRSRPLICFTYSVELVLEHIRNRAVDLVVIDNIGLTPTDDEVDLIRAAARVATPSVEVQVIGRTTEFTIQALLAELEGE
ncbi:MAG: hypothetical protein CEN92_336 [Candidatus Berkelbacteria bacterium Licking1014_96]|uniref:Uncharacterized protein n=1 Tax=Candidatus Berkelbacteria bacterium Licking1014_96 TaxID=2017149 RepID=A0A554LDN3_9BACT|nr:MAG: hypothetical protein CEN92_336 [Candidatus Berkelbacteria bacterium Licking1014_96]